MCEDLSTEVEADMEEAKTVEGGASTTESGAASTEGGSPSVRVLSAEEAKETDITEVCG